MGDKKVCDNICLGSCKWSFHLLPDLETPPEWGLVISLLGVHASLKWEFMAVLIFQKFLLLVR